MNRVLLIKRIYKIKNIEDGYRILVDRLWPRGVSKMKASLDLWLKDIAPSTDLRTWFGHDPNKWQEFKKRYIEELKNNKQSVDKLTKIIETHKTVTLLYGAKDQEHNEALVIKDYFENYDDYV